MHTSRNFPFLSLHPVQELEVHTPNSEKTGFVCNQLFSRISSLQYVRLPYTKKLHRKEEMGNEMAQVSELDCIASSPSLSLQQQYHENQK